MPYTSGLDVLEPAFPDRPIPYITYGLPFSNLVASHLYPTLQAKRVYIICSASIARNTTALADLRNAITSTTDIPIVGIRIGMRPHTHWNDVLEVAADARKAFSDPPPSENDVLITLGAGSLTDGAKVIAWMLANPSISTKIGSDGLDLMWSGNPDKRTDLAPPLVRHIAIPTSLSGGEYQSIAGVTRDDGSDQKCLFEPPARNPSLVVLDPQLTITTPERIWLSTGVRGIDHCVETLCSLQSNEKGDDEAAKGLRRLVPALLKTRRDPGDLNARFDSMMGVIQAMSAVGSGVPLGASHAIGHQLGPLGVGHGETSCVMLPAVCKWNKAQDANVERQARCMGILLQSPEVQKLINDNVQTQGQVDLGDVLDLIIRALGMPRTLRDVGVGEDKLDVLANNSLKDPWITTNAKPITEKEQALEILRMVVS